MYIRVCGIRGKLIFVKYIKFMYLHKHIRFMYFVGVIYELYAPIIFIFISMI